MQNMFQEGLYHVFFQERPLPRSQQASSSPENLREARIVRWLQTVVNTRLLVTGVLQVVGSLASILATVSFICMDLDCSVSMTAPIWCGIFYVATGGLTIHVHKKPSKVKVITLMGLNIFCLLLAAISILTYCLRIASETSPMSREQRMGAYVAKGSSIFFTLQCALASAYVLFLIRRGLSRYSTPYREMYTPILQECDEYTDSVLDTADHGL